MKDQIDVLLVEDSPVAQLLLAHILHTDPRLRVVGTVSDGEEALSFLAQTRPDVIVMDIHLPGIDGYETTRRIMETQPVPIVICSASFQPTEVVNTFRAMEAGAVAVVAKPPGPHHPEYDNLAGQLVEKVRLMSEVSVVKRWPRAGRPRAHPLPAPRRPGASSCPRVVAVGASTGGPPALQAILRGLPADFAAPVLIVQHITPGFLPGLAEWIGQTAALPVHVAAHGEAARAGHAYLAPDGYHMGFGADGRIELSRRAPEHGLRPSVAYLFRSVADACGADAVAVLLSGMGRDGADELKHLRDLGAVTIVQDAESSVVHGMPGEAIRLGAACHVLSLDEIAAALTRLVPSRPNESPLTS